MNNWNKIKLTTYLMHIFHKHMYEHRFNILHDVWNRQRICLVENCSPLLIIANIYSFQIRKITTPFLSRPKSNWFSFSIVLSMCNCLLWTYFFEFTLYLITYNHKIALNFILEINSTFSVVICSIRLQKKFHLPFHCQNQYLNIFNSEVSR